MTILLQSTAPGYYDTNANQTLELEGDRIGSMRVLHYIAKFYHA